MFNKNNFTLIELIVVIAILGILASIVIPNISDFQQKAKQTRLIADLRNTQTAVDMFALDHYGDLPSEEQPYRNNEEIDWPLLYTDYIRDIPKLEDNQKFYVTPHGIVTLNYDSYAPELSWLRNSKMIVKDSSDPEYGGINPPVGGVFLNYNMDTNTFTNYQNKSQMLTLSTCIVGDAMNMAFKATGDESFLNNSILIGDYLKSITTTKTFWGKSFNYISPMHVYENGTWNLPEGEYYSKDAAIAAKFLIDLSVISNDQSYAETGKDLLDTLIQMQDIVGVSGEDANLKEIYGALPEKGFDNSMSFNLYPLDIAYMVQSASDTAYTYFKDSKYKKFGDDYITFVEKTFDELGGLSTGGYPYEYLTYDASAGEGKYFDGVNHNQLDYNLPYSEQFGAEKPFTTDQFFYTVLGLKRAGSKYTSDMYYKAKDLMTADFDFHGQYNFDGTPTTTMFEVCNTAFFLEFAKQMEPRLVPEIEQSLLNKGVRDNSDLNSNYGWAWSKGEEYVESLVSALAVHNLIINDLLIK